MMRRDFWIGLGLVASAACSSSRPPSTSREIKFGARVAQHGYWREARFRFEKAARQEPANARAHNDLAVALEALGEFGAAFEEYKKAVALDPGSRAIQRNYAKFAEFYTARNKTVGKAAHAP
jgi:Flp pilus assembly protein TadD